MSTQLDSFTSPELGIRALKAAPVIVATDGRDQSDPAIVVGRVLAGADDALRVVTVLRPLPAVAVEAPLPPDVEAARRADQKRTVVEQVRRLCGDADLDVEFQSGDPAGTIARVAHESDATMIVAGLGRHGVMDRLFGDETALRLIRLAGVPVLAVTSGLRDAPRRIVVAIDFSETSLRAARMSLDLVAMGGTVHLTHVAPRDSTLDDWDTPGSSYKRDAVNALQNVREQLRIPGDISVQRILLQGDPATELLAFAASVNADLVSTGSHGRGFVTRMFLGSVTTRILRAATRSVLCVPHRATMTRDRMTFGLPATAGVSASEWMATHEVFTGRAHAADASYGAR